MVECLDLLGYASNLVNLVYYPLHSLHHIQTAREGIIDLLPHDTTNLLSVVDIQHMFHVRLVVVHLLINRMRIQHMLHLPLFSYHLARLIVHVLLNPTMRQGGIALDLINPPLNRTRGFHSHFQEPFLQLLSRKEHYIQSLNLPLLLQAKMETTR